MPVIMKEFTNNEPAATTGVTATATGNELDALRQHLNVAAASGAKPEVPRRETHSVVVGTDDKPAPDDTQETAGAVPPMPEGGVAKFYNAVTGAYNWEGHAKEAEFRAKMAAGKAARKAERAAGADTVEGATDDGGKNLVEKAGLDWEELGEKLSVLGDIEESDYRALEEIGIPNEVVKAHIEGVRAMVELTKQQLYQKTGGPEGAKALMEWARQNLNEAEIRGYDEMLAGPQWPVAIDALIARSGFRPTQTPTLVRPATASTPAGGDVYTSAEEQQADFSSPLYKTSEDFRQKVYAKMARTERARSLSTPAPLWKRQFGV